MARTRWSLAWVAVLVAAAAACGSAHSADREATVATSSSTSSTTSTSTTVVVTTAAPLAPATSAPAPSTTKVRTPAPTTTQPATTLVPAAARIAPGQTFAPFAKTGGVVLLHPSARVERIGFHESNNDGAQVLQPLATTISPTIMETRDRGNSSTTAADIVVEPGTELRAPVTGRVLRAGHYTLYCDTPDEYLVIEPDAHPGWEVKLLHVVGVLVHKGERVTAGITPVALHAHQLPFESQVDELATVQPPWPHVHLEVVDPSIPDRPTPGGCG